MLLCTPLPFAPNYSLIHETWRGSDGSRSQHPRAASRRGTSLGPRLEGLQPSPRAPGALPPPDQGDGVPAPGCSRVRLRRGSGERGDAMGWTVPPARAAPCRVRAPADPSQGAPLVAAGSEPPQTLPEGLP